MEKWFVICMDTHENNGYGIYFTSENNTGVTSASVLSVEDDLTFQVIRSDDVIIFNE